LQVAAGGLRLGESDEAVIGCTPVPS